MSTSAKAGKAARSTDTDAPAHDSRGGRGASLAAPPSGMHFVDGAAPAPGPAVLQAKRAGVPAQSLPPALQDGIESMSGLSMDDVRVHYNSQRPAQLGALAYAQGREIHLGPGQEHALPHEAWHVVQQAQGRVRPALQAKGGPAINDQQHLEREADAMGAQALSTRPTAAPRSGLSAAPPSATGTDAVVQCWPGFIDRWLQKRRGFTPVEDPDRDLAEQAKLVGHQAQETGETVDGQRRDMFIDGAVQVGVEGAKMGLDALTAPTIGVPVGTAVGGAMSLGKVAHSGKKAHKKKGKGKSVAKAMGTEMLKEGASEAVGNIPVVGEFIGMVEGVGKMAYAVLQSDQSRYDEKQHAMDELVSQHPVIARAEQRLKEGGLEPDAQRRLEKAVDRYYKTLEKGQAWQGKKAENGKMPLLAREFE